MRHCRYQHVLAFPYYYAALLIICTTIRWTTTQRSDILARGADAAASPAFATCHGCGRRVKQPFTVDTLVRKQQRRYGLPRDSSLTPTTQLFESSFLEPMQGESKDAFFRRMTAAASDPATFESLVLSSSRSKNTNHHQPKTIAANGSSSSSSTVNSNNSTDSQQPAEPPSKPKGYVRAEDWEREQEEQAKSMSWEKRVQFDGQRHGDGFQQNEILRHNLYR